MYNSGGTMMCSVDGFRLTVCGRGAHGAYPHGSIDPINIGVHIYLALEALIAREADPGLTPVPDTSASASEDFATVAERVPSVFMYLSAGYLDERGDAPAHNPKVRFNEDVCPIGSACLAHCAVRWLEEH